MKLISRRGLLIGAGVIGGGFIVGMTIAGRHRDVLKPAGDDEVVLNAYLKIAKDGTVTVVTGRAEMGQGTHGSLAQIAADELDVPWEKVTVMNAPADRIYGRGIFDATFPGKNAEPSSVSDSLRRWAISGVNGIFGIVLTGGSSSIRQDYNLMREAGAAAREMLIAAAAKAWNVPADEVVAAGGMLSHATGKKASYGEMASAAAKESIPSSPKLKSPKDFKLIGQPLARPEFKAIVTGTQIYGIDVEMPDLLVATVVQSPVFGGKPKKWDENAAKAVPGVTHVVVLPHALAVVADGYWHAKQGLDQLGPEWDDGPDAGLTSEAIAKSYAERLDVQGEVIRKTGDTTAALASAQRKVSATYSVPFLDHACMEPQNCTARVKDGKVEIWSGTQSSTLARLTAARAAGVEDTDVITHVLNMGGGFGRRAETEIVAQAVMIAKETGGKPVKLIWSREEDMTHGTYRPVAQARFDAGLDAAGTPLAWRNRVVLQSTMAGFVGRNAPFMPGSGGGAGGSATEGAANIPYAIPNVQVEHHLMKLPVPVGFWRSVGSSQNAFFVESFIDELAAEAGVDPVDYRRKLLAEEPRHRAVLEAAAEKSQWGAPLAPGRGRGIALHESFGSIAAQVVEVTVAEGKLKVDRIVAVLDCGEVINPSSVAAQIEGSVLFGLSAALWGEITLNAGRVQQTNFFDYDVVRFATQPKVETHIIRSGAALGGVGEPATPPVAPALANAVFSATGKRARSLPLKRLDWIKV